MSARQRIRLTARGQFLADFLAGVLALVVIPLGGLVIIAGLMR